MIVFSVFCIRFSFSAQQIFDQARKAYFLENDESECFYDRLYTNSISSNSVVCLIRCTFKSLKSESNGGAVVISLRNRFGTKNYINYCTFTDCRSNNGGAIYLNIEKNVTTEIFNSVFIQNKAIDSGSGGAIYIISKVKCNFKVNNCTFNTNSAIKNGGSIYFSNLSFIFEKCKFYKNDANCYGDSMDGGGSIYSEYSNGSFANCFFINNIARSYFEVYGGAVLSSSSNSSFIGCIFTNNTSLSTKYSAYGGAIYFSKSSSSNFTSNIVFQDIVFTNNSAYSNYDSSGGAIYISVTYYMYRTYFIKLNYLFRNIIFTNNTAYSGYSSSSGGAIYLSLSNNYYSSYSKVSLITNCSFINSTFTNNSAFTNTSLANVHAYGGAIRLSNISGTFQNCLFNNNAAKTVLNVFLTSGDEPRSIGGAIHLNFTNFEFIECSFNNNTGFGDSPKHVSTSQGGAICSLNSIVHLSKINFINNTLFNFGHKFDIDCYIEGGACYFSNSNVDISECNFYNNTVMLRASENSIYFSARLYGGAIYFHSKISSIKCQNCIFKNNLVLVPNHKEKEFAGAIYMTRGTLNKCTFNDNVAYNGCDLRYDQIQNSFLEVSNCYFHHSVNKNHQIQSLIHFRVSYNKSTSNVFTGNQVVSNLLSYLFDGEMESNTAVLKIRFNNNCMSPYEKEFYKTNNLMIYNEVGKSLESFYSAFKSK